LGSSCRYIVVVHPIRSKFLCTRAKCLLAVAGVWILKTCFLGFSCRYIVVVHPIRSKFLCTRAKCLLVVAGVWILSLLLSGPVLLTDVSNS
jgi:hypothetical protein